MSPHRAAFVMALLSCGLAYPGGRVIEIPGAGKTSSVPPWDARGIGPLPWQGIACLDVSEDGRFVAVGTISPPGDPNLILLDETGRVVGQHRVGLRWVSEVAVSNDGQFLLALCAAPDGASDDWPRLYAVHRGKAQPLWTRRVSPDVAASPEPEKGLYGPATPPYEDVKFQAPLAVAIDAEGEQMAVADYEGWQRVFRPRDRGAPYGTVLFRLRFMPSRPTIHVYGPDGRPLRRVGPEAFAEPFWCDLAFSPDRKKLLISPHNWACRGLGGKPFLPADENARSLYLLDIATGNLDTVRFPDAVSSVACAAQARTVGRGAWGVERGASGVERRAWGVERGASGVERLWPPALYALRFTLYALTLYALRFPLWPRGWTPVARASFALPPTVSA